MRVTIRAERPRVRSVLLAAALLSALLPAACASSSTYDSVGEMRSEAMRPERQVPDELTAMREDVSGIRQEAGARMDDFMGAAPADTTPWYGPLFDALDFAVSIFRLF